MSTPAHPPDRHGRRPFVVREARRAPLPFVLVGIVVAILGYWITRHWHLSGGVATGVWFVMLFLWIGVLSFWFGRKRGEKETRKL